MQSLCHAPCRLCRCINGVYKRVGKLSLLLLGLLERVSCSRVRLTLDTSLTPLTCSLTTKALAHSYSSATKKLKHRQCGKLCAGSGKVLKEVTSQFDARSDSQDQNQKHVKCEWVWLGVSRCEWVCVSECGVGGLTSWQVGRNERQIRNSPNSSATRALRLRLMTEI